MKIVIPSRGRSKEIQDGALRLFPNATVCVGESEAKDYEYFCPKLLVHPDNVEGIGPLRQWIIDNVEDEIVVQVDDDVHTVYSICGLTKRTYHDPQVAARIVATTAICAKDAGCKVFGFNQAWDVRKFRPYKPFQLNTWVGGVVGVIGKERRYDISLKLRADIDFCLQSLLKDRIVWSEQRYSFVHKRWSGRGGNAEMRSEERHKQEMEYLQKKWGKYVSFQEKKTAVRMVMHVER